MKITAKVKRKLIAAKKKAGVFLKNKKNRKWIFAAIGILALWVIYSQYGKRTTTTTTTKPIEGGTGGKVDNGGGGYIPPVYIPDVFFGDVVVTDTITAKLWYQGWEPHCEIRITGTPGNWRLKDWGTEALPNGCIWRYQVNGHVFHQSTRLDNYEYLSNDPVTIWLVPIYTDKQNIGLHFWGTEGWQDPNLSPGFSSNNSLGFSYYIFNKAAV